MMKFKSQGEEITPFVERRGAGLERYVGQQDGTGVKRQKSLML